jgi:uncharacterized membrane protein YjjB (DUF3815 family)
MTDIIQIITGFFGALGFALLYNIRGKRLVAAAIGGFMSWFLFLAMGWITDSEPVRYFIVSILISVYAEILARILKTPTTTFIITSLIPLIPGGALYYTMSSAFSGSLEIFLGNAQNTLSLSLALALGVMVVTASTQLILRLISVNKHHKNT